MNHARDPRHHTEDSEVEQGARPGTEGPAGGDAAPGAEAAEEELNLRRVADTLGRLEAEREELRQTLARRQADFENYRKRVERERRDDRDRGLVLLAESLLPVLDNFERALAAHQDPAYEEYRRGFEMIYRQLTDLLVRLGVARMEDPTGRPFDPHLHHAIERVETGEVPEGTVLGEVQAGYRFRDRVLRPSQVRVAVESDRSMTDDRAAN